MLSTARRADSLLSLCPRVLRRLPFEKLLKTEFSEKKKFGRTSTLYASKALYLDLRLWSMQLGLRSSATNGTARRYFWRPPYSVPFSPRPRG